MAFRSQGFLLNNIRCSIFHIVVKLLFSLSPVGSSVDKSWGHAGKGVAEWGLIPINTLHPNLHSSIPTPPWAPIGGHLGASQRPPPPDPQDGSWVHPSCDSMLIFVSHEISKDEKESPKYELFASKKYTREQHIGIFSSQGILLNNIISAVFFILW